MKASVYVNLLLLFSLVTYCCRAQTAGFPEHLQNTMVAKLKNGDSLVYYQCHVEEVTPQLSTASGQTVITNPEKYSITEKYVITNNSGSYLARYYISSLLILPNRKFSGLKIREKEYWNFKKLKEKQLAEKDLQILGSLEYKGKEPTEYDFAVTKYNTNELIIRQRKDFKQLLISGNYIISKMLFE